MKAESADEHEVDLHGGHRDVTGGAQRAAVFGISDGLVTNVSLILGVAGAHPSAAAVRLAGFAGLMAGACSMAIGEYISMKAQGELISREIAVEEEEIRRNPAGETKELANLYERRGLSKELAMEVAKALMAQPRTALEVHAMEELGVGTGSLGSPWQAALSSFASFAVGAFVPLVAWLFFSSATAVTVSILMTAVASLVVGAALAYFTGRSYAVSALRQLGLSALASALTYLVGYLVGGGQL
jgi:VIT1/CCC1 family predicted Fe2+/Mn2+ transporter